MNVMWVPLLVVQGICLLSLLLWWPSWSGKSTFWLEGRGWGMATTHLALLCHIHASVGSKSPRDINGSRRSHT